MKQCYKSNTVVLLRVPYTTLNKEKIRPAIIIRDAIDQDILILPITSQNKNCYDIFIPNEQVQGFTFCKDSFIRIHKITTLHSNRVIKRLGTLEESFFEFIKKQSIDFIENNPSLK